MYSRVSAWQRARVTITRCNAALIWRLPPESRRWRTGVARAGRDRRDAGGARELGGRREAVSAGDLADELGGDQRPESRLGEQLRCDLFDEGSDVAFELGDRLSQFAQAAQLVASDADAHRLLGARETPADARRPLLGEQGAAGRLELGPQVVQVPRQGAVEFDAVADEPFAVIDQQPQIELGAVELRGGKGV